MCDNTCKCDNSLTINQTKTNTQILVPVAAKSEYELAIESGQIPEDTTLEEWLNRPNNIPAINIVEYGENV